jgi:Protein of unknown function (DUF2817)
MRLMPSPNVIAAFSQTYAEAREKFLAAAKARGLTVETHVHPSARGADGEALAVDVAVLGPAEATSLLCLISGTHGVEGFCGSGAQIALLEDAAVGEAITQSGAAILFYHALNPYGFSYCARANEDNVDMNRNFRDFSHAPPRNAAYAEVHDFIVPATWPPTPENEARIGAYIAARGQLALQAAVSGGQCDRPDGIFYGGNKPAWSNGVFRDVLRRHAASRRRLAWIDFHTGLGPYGHAEKIHSGPNDAAMIARAKAWWGIDVTSFHDGSSTSAPLTGVNYEAPLAECPGVECTGIALEYGTLSFFEVLQGLRADQWLHNHPDANAATRTAIKRLSRDAFYCDADDWKGMVYGQARAAVLQALQALGTGHK